MKRFAAAAVAVVALSSPAFAQMGKSNPDCLRREKNMQCHVFGGDNVDGTVTKPEHDYIPVPPRPGFESMIKIRGSFHAELGKSVENL